MTADAEVAEVPAEPAWVPPEPYDYPDLAERYDRIQAQAVTKIAEWDEQARKLVFPPRQPEAATEAITDDTAGDEPQLPAEEREPASHRGPKRGLFRRAKAGEQHEPERDAADAPDDGERDHAGIWLPQAPEQDGPGPSKSGTVPPPVLVHLADIGTENPDFTACHAQDGEATMNGPDVTCPDCRALMQPPVEEVMPDGPAPRAHASVPRPVAEPTGSAAAGTGEAGPGRDEAAPSVTCRTCGGFIEHYDSPHGSWWSHLEHPEDGHDARPDCPQADVDAEQFGAPDEPFWPDDKPRIVPPPETTEMTAVLPLPPESEQQ